ncbi:MAG: hypothetical protein DCF19_03135 [Pseudanabaena frigida]|uniref:Uncharacterized protein n=1 Tax=Pseudanabaena frigida TaxID=945775 RepID=A0A2W4YML2_9CYAN|nr:MAG: hypothetical protein DCF19_03135 [Pseudanabaena frigida]
MKTSTLKILALTINLLGIPATLLTGIFAVEAPIILIYASNGRASFWAIAALGFCFVLLPILLIGAEISGWQNFKQRKYIDSISAYKWVLADLLIMLFLAVAMSAGWVNK